MLIPSGSEWSQSRGMEKGKAQRRGQGPRFAEAKVLGSNPALFQNISQLVPLFKPQVLHLVEEGAETADPGSFQLRQPVA